MTKDILLYGYIDSWSASQFISDFDDVLSENPEEITVRLNTPGGDVDYAVGVIAKFVNASVKKNCLVDGKAHSMGAFLCAHADKVIANEYSQFVVHRCSYPDWIESDSTVFNENRQKMLKDNNKKLRAALEAKIDVKKFEQITGYTLDEVFSMDGVLDVMLTAQEAKRIGLVDAIEKISLEKKAAIDAKLLELSAKQNGLSGKFRIAAATEDPNDKKSKTRNNMKLSELQADHPALLQEVKEASAKEAVETEKQRVDAWMHFVEVDPKAVREGIKSGKAITQVEIIELTEKKLSKRAKADIEEDSQKDALTTGEAPSEDGSKPKPGTPSAKAKELEDFKKGALENSNSLKSYAKKG